MAYSRKFLLVLIILGLLCSCTQTPQQRAKDATVLIIVGNADGNISYGSGFFVESDKIATNIHVVDSAKIVFAVGRKKVYNIEGVTGHAPEHDLVILKVSGKGKPLELGEGKIDDPIFVTGYPGGGYDVTKGTVHGIRESDRELRLVAKGFPKNRDAVLVPGNSGGPVLNSEGQVIGIAVGGKISLDKDLSWAIASSMLNTLLDSPDTESLSEWQKTDSVLAYVYSAWSAKKLKSEDYEEAIKGFDKAIEGYQGYAKVYQERGHAKSDYGFYQEAIQDYTEAIELIPDDAVAYYNRGNAKQKNEDYIGAIQDYNKALKLNPYSTSSYLNRGVAKGKLLNYAGEIQDYTEGIKQKPKNLWSYYYNRGNAKRQSKDYDGAIEDDTEAIRLIEEAIRLIEDDTEAIRLKDDFAAAYLNRGLAKVRMSEPDYEGAIEDYTNAINLNPDNVTLRNTYLKRSDAKKSLGQDENANLDYAKAYYYWGNAYLNNRNYQAAIEKLDVTIDDKLVQNRPEPYNSRGDAYRLRGEKGDYQKAIENYDKVIDVYDAAVEPVYIEMHVIYNARGLANAADGNYDEAIKDYTKAIELKLDYAEAHYDQGVAQHHLSKYQEAVDDLSKAIKFKDDYANAYEARGVAKEALEEAADAKEDFAMADYLRGKEAYEGGRYLEAIKNFDTYLELIPNIAPVHYTRGKAKTEHGKSKVALGDLENALKLYQAAIEDCDKSIEFGSANKLADYYSHRGQTKFLRGAIRDHKGMIEDYESAIEDFTEAIERKLDLVDTYYLRGRTRCLLGYVKANYRQSKEARRQYNLALEEDFKEAIKLDDDNAKYYGGLGLANAALGKAKATIDAFEKAKQLEETKSGN